MAMRQTQVVVIGGGITGLSAAWFLQTHGCNEYMILESSPKWGGKVQTEHVETEVGNFVIEYGPDSFITQKPQGVNLAKSLGLDSELLPTNDANRRVYVVNKGKLTPMPDGMMLIIPTRFMPFATSPLISIPGKLRMGLEPFIPAKNQDEDESLANFVRRRLGQEAVDKLAEPLLSGIYNTAAEQQSLMATFPRFRAIENKYGSLTRGMIAAKNHAPQSKKQSLFVSMREGMGQIISALIDNLTGDMRLNANVESISKNIAGGYEIHLGNGDIIQTDAVVITVPAHPAAQLIRKLEPEIASILESIPYVSTGTMSLAYRNADLPMPLNGFGIVVPRTEKRPINAITWSSSKLEHRAPDGFSLIRVFFGGARSPQTMDLETDELLGVVQGQLRELMEITATPYFTKTCRWRAAVPQYHVGHVEAINRLEALLPTGLYVAGGAYRGAGLPDCIASAERAALKTIETLNTPLPATQ
jgi:oxygen-dependent protoporphyrinogen oxidase